jgi:hypothetical protein
MKTRKPVRFLIALAFGGTLFGCAKLTSSTAESLASNVVVNSSPMSGFTLNTTDIYSASVMSNGNALTPARWTMTGNGDVFGTFDYTNGTITYRRPDVTGPCTNGALTAPSCGFTWGGGTNGVYHGGDYNLFPDAPALSNTFKMLKYVQVDIHHELATGDLSGGMSDCGIDLGFGTGATSPGGPLTSNNFRLPGRTSSNQDMVKFAHRYSSGSEQMLIEAPLNNATDPSYTMWGLASFDTSYNMTKNSIPSLNGDYVDFRMWLVFDHVAKTVTIKTMPLATNKTLSAMQTQTVTWNYNNPHNATAGGEARGGLMFGTGTHPLSITDFENSRASVGFFANGVARSCGFTNVQVGTLKAEETVSTPFNF